MKWPSFIFAGYLCLILGAVIFVGVVYMNSRYHTLTRTFSPYTVLASSWEKYVQHFMNTEGRVIDYSGQKDITTSEGQSYAMLRAVWLGDKERFDLSWQWTQTNLRRSEDQLFGWRWGKRANDTYGFLDDGGYNSASDAESDIALALIFAGERWQDPTYTAQAREILTHVWALETAEIDSGKRYLAAGNWAVRDDGIVINPSYFAPYAWRIFAQVDPRHDWNSLIDPAYELLFMTGNLSLDTDHSVGLPPDWVLLHNDGRVSAYRPQGQTMSHYSYDAVRIPWRVALDYLWNGEERAYQYLVSSFDVLAERYEQDGYLVSSYSHDGEPLSRVENPVMYVSLMSHLLVDQPEAAQRVFEDKIMNLYSTDANGFPEHIPYYEQNWLWFGAGLYYQFLTPLYS